MHPEQWKAGITGILATALMALLIVWGSGNLKHIDAALVGYTFATLFSVFGIAYRYSMWLQRPPTRMYWRRGWQSFVRPGRRLERLTAFARRIVEVFLLNLFIWHRHPARGLTHSLLMWGCLLAGAITFPLVFGWVHFETVPGDLNLYRLYVFGVGLMSFHHASWFGGFIFHGLVWSAFLVLAGVLMALRRRLKDHGAAALQDFREDLMPLILLFAVSVTGLLLTVSYTWMEGYGYDFLALLHAIVVIMTLVWLPFGKFFHIFQRPAQLGVKFYRDMGNESDQARCLRCQEPYATRIQIEDLIKVEQQLGYRYQLAEGHYQQVCPACRRKMMILSQGVLWKLSAESREHGR